MQSPGGGQPLDVETRLMNLEQMFQSFRTENAELREKNNFLVQEIKRQQQQERNFEQMVMNVIVYFFQ
jgi:hypothetical protein